MRLWTPQTKKTYSVLTIDDEKPVRESIRHFLEDCGYDVLEAADGKSGLEIFKSQNPDLILVDLRMPGMDGLEVLDRISRKSRKTPIIVISGTGVIGDVVEALRRGAWDFLLKPIEDMEVLRHAVEKSLERSELIDLERQYQRRLEVEVSRKTKELTDALDQVTDVSLEIIYRLSRAADCKDEATGNHIKRMSLYSYSIACQMGMEANLADQIKYASPMHDVGKIGIPDSILLKKGKLTPGEWDIMKRHTTIGARILEGSDIRFIKIAQKIALYHHERWDGRGYPTGLKGEEIPLEARITAVADVYDALSTARPYKDPYPLDICEEIILESSETAFDPQIVSAFMNCRDDFLNIQNTWKD